LNVDNISAWDYNLFGWYHFSRDSFEISADTSVGNWQGAGTHAFIFNDGIRDTIIWSIDEDYIPDWLEVYPLHDIFPPLRSNHYDTFVEFSIRQDSFPDTLFGRHIPIVFSHNLGVDTLFLKFSIF